MAILYVTEFSNYNINMNPNQQGQQPPVNEQTVALSGASAQSAAFKSNTNFVRISNDSSSAINYVFGTNPTAVVSTNARLSAGAAEYFIIPQGQAYKVAAINVAL